MKLRNLAVLEQKITETQAEKTKLEQAWETAQNRLQLAKEEETKATANVFNAKNQLKKAARRRKKQRNSFYESLQQAQFCEEDMYRQAKMSEGERQTIRRRNRSI